MTDAGKPALGRFALGLLAGTAVVSTGLAALAFYNYHRTDRYLHESLRAMEDRGRRASAVGCVDAVLRWRRRCPLAAVLCDNFSARAMGACLASRDRSGYCRSLPARRGTTRFGYADCKRRGVTRRTRKACAAAYRVLDQYCRRPEVIAGRTPARRGAWERP